MTRRRLAVLALAGCYGPGCHGPASEGPVADAGDPVFVEVGTAATLGGAASQGTSFRWDFGDGSADVDGLPYATVEHTFDHPGHFVAILRAEDDEGRSATDTVSITAVRPPQSAGFAGTSGTLVAADDGSRLFAALPDFDKVAVVDRATHAVTHLDTCDRPRSVSFNGGLLAVACEGDAVDLFFDDATTPVRAVMPYGSRPYGVIARGHVPEALAAIVTLQGSGEVIGVVADGSTYWQMDVGPDVRGIAQSVDSLIVTRHRSPDQGGHVWLYEGGTGPYAWRRGLLPPDPGPDSDTNARGVPTYLQRVIIGIDGVTAYTGGLKANVERGLVRDGQALDHQTTVRADLRAFSPVTGEELGHTLFDDRDFVSSIVEAPAGDWLYVTIQGAEVVETIDPWTLGRVSVAYPDVRAPDGIWASDDGELWVLGSLSRELVCLDLSVPGAPGEELARVDLRAGLPEPLPAEVLAGAVIFHRSADRRLTKSGYVSCASCHLGGDADGRTWDFTDRGEGLRNTISLAGHAGRAPIHWSANFDEVQDFENDIRGPMAGEGFLTDAQWGATQDTLGAPKAGLSPELDALAAYVSSLSTYPRSPFRDPETGALTAAAERGQALFEDASVGCATCHSGPDFTDSAFAAPGEPVLHDVGTITADSGQRLGGPLVGLDTPTLRGVWETPPYLHDGSAPTLRDVLTTKNAADEHGVTSGLSDPQIDDLVAYLQSLE